MPINPYGASKLAFEGALRWLGEAHPFRWTALRYFNAAGADLDGEVGESHEPETHLIPNLCKAALGTGPALTVFGQDYPTPDGTPIRDYIHVVDLAEAHVLAIRRPQVGRGRQWGLQCRNGRGATVMQIIAAAEARAREARSPIPVGPRRAGRRPPSLSGRTPLRLKADVRLGRPGTP